MERDGSVHPLRLTRTYKRLKLKFEERVTHILDRKKDPYAFRTAHGHRFYPLRYFKWDPEWQAKLTYRENGRTKVEYFVVVWAGDPTRASCHTSVFAPPPLSVPEGALNLYVGLAVQDVVARANYEADGAASVPPELLRHIGRLAGIRAEEPLDGDPRWEFLMNWLAHLFQAPGERCDTMLVLVSEHDLCGKSVFTDFIGDMLGGNESRQLYGTTRRWGGVMDVIRDRLLIVVDDVLPRSFRGRMVRTLMQMLTSQDSAITCRLMWTAYASDIQPLKEHMEHVYVFTCDPSLSFEGATYHTAIKKMMDAPMVQHSFYEYLLSRRLLV